MEVVVAQVSYWAVVVALVWYLVVAGVAPVLYLVVVVVPVSC